MSGRGSEAEPLLQRALAGSPPYPRAALLLARYYNDTGRPREALAVAAPLCASGRRRCGAGGAARRALVALGRQEEAVAGYRELLAAAPDNLAAAQALAIALNMSGRSRGCRACRAARTDARARHRGALQHLRPQPHRPGRARSVPRPCCASASARAAPRRGAQQSCAADLDADRRPCPGDRRARSRAADLRQR